MTTSMLPGSSVGIPIQADGSGARSGVIIPLAPAVSYDVEGIGDVTPSSSPPIPLVGMVDAINRSCLENFLFSVHKYHYF
jgi:hypothetical protein